MAGYTQAENFGFLGHQKSDRQKVGPKQRVFPEKMGHAPQADFFDLPKSREKRDGILWKNKHRRNNRN
jgi:hypothetical protein